VLFYKFKIPPMEYSGSFFCYSFSSSREEGIRTRTEPHPESWNEMKDGKHVKLETGRGAEQLLSQWLQQQKFTLLVFVSQT